MKLITGQEAAEMLSIGLQRLYELVRQGVIPHVKIGSRQLRFDSNELQAWAKNGGAVADNRIYHSKGDQG